MKRMNYFLFLLAIAFYACQSEHTIPNTLQPLSIQIQSRGATLESLPIGSTILFNATGQLQVENKKLTYNGNHWESEQPFQWSSTQEHTHITAIYPICENYTYTSEYLYANGTLEDILIAQDTLSIQSDINLEFHHLFSLLNVEVEDSLLKKLQDIRLTTPYKITSLSPSTGEFQTTNENYTYTCSTGNEETYTFIIPPAEDCRLTLALVMKDQTIHEYTLEPHHFLSGNKYTCRLIQEDTRPGIRTASDLITFSKLINGTYTGEKDLNLFGTLQGDQYVFQLLADIEFTDEESLLLSPIGNNDSKAFAHIFEGNGHTLSNIILADVKETGLFGYVKENGVIRNLHLKNIKIEDPSTCKHVGAIATRNYGYISNCSVQESNLTATKTGSIGFICAYSFGTLINCYTINNNTDLINQHTAGGIVGTAGGKILNCYTRNNQFSRGNSSCYYGCIAGTANESVPLIIENCYTYQTTSVSSAWGSVIGLLVNGVTINHYFYNKGNLYCSKYGTSNSITNTHKYDTNFCYENTLISTLLNEWITDNNHTNYPEHSFCSWTTANGFPCFQ